MSKIKPLSKAILAVNVGLFSLTFNHQSLAQEGVDDENLEEVFVTGSRIRKANLVSSAPITQIDAGEIRFQGVVRVEDMMRNIPQIYSAQNSGQANGATGTATIDLRNLGEERTLTLLNGRRLPAGSPIQGGIGADVNQIPATLIKNVEILTGGASAVYGSDAVAGVINFQLVDDFEGVQLDVQRSIYRHGNDNLEWRGLTQESGYPFPVGNTSDGAANQFSLTVGGNFAEDRGNVTAYATYRNIDPVLQADRDYSACGFSNTSDQCLGSGTIAEGRVVGTIPGTNDTFDYKVVGDTFQDTGDTTFNFGPLNYFQRPDERFTMGAMARYEINEHAEFYSEFNFMDDRSVAQIAPAGAFFVEVDLSCDNPLLSEQQFDALCGNFGLGREDSQTVDIAKRNVEGGNRQHDLRHTSNRMALGLRGDINPIWSYDVYYQYSEVSMENTYLNDLSITKISRALDVVSDENGNIVCRSALEGYDTNCVPWNIFETGAVTSEMTDYLSLPLFARGTTKQTVFSGYLSADLSEYGVISPGASTGVSLAFGFENRMDALQFAPDQGFQSGDGAGQGGATLPVDADYSVNDYFIELQVPLIENVPGVQSLALDFAVRDSSYDTGINADSLGIGMGWEINSSLKLRASYQEAVRAPNVRELFLPQGLNLENLPADPCGGEVTNGTTASGRTFEECARTGVTAEQFGNIPNNPAGQYNFLQGGNPDLEAEEGETFTLGVVVTPSFVDGLSVTLDYFDIEISNGIDNLSPITILNACLDGNTAFCDDIRRNATRGDLWRGSSLGSSGFVTAFNNNLAIETAKGFDLILDYDVSLGGGHSLVFNSVTSYLTEFNKTEFVGAEATECAGAWGGACEDPTIDLRNNFRTTWITPWTITASVLLRHMSEVEDISVAEEADKQTLDAINYVDLSVLWAPVEQFEFRLGINNVFDEEPPIAGGNAGPSNGGNGNTFPGTYDSLGQFIFAGVNFKF
ncbi:MAG: TonB-dependent receptor [Cellvibrionaceae bacterium]|nr:TonB-dependent receptor [Cellvibrionaceae bacterium]